MSSWIFRKQTQRSDCISTSNTYRLSYRPSSSMREPAPCSESSRSGRRATRTSTNAWPRTWRARSPSMPSCPSSEVSPARARSFMWTCPAFRAALDSELRLRIFVGHTLLTRRLLPLNVNDMQFGFIIIVSIPHLFKYSYSHPIL